MSAPEKQWAAKAAKALFQGQKAGETAEINSSLHHLKNSPGVARHRVVQGILNRSIPSAQGPAPLHINDRLHAADFDLSACSGVCCVAGPAHAGILKASPRCSTAQHMRAFLAAMATTARQ